MLRPLLLLTGLVLLPATALASPWTLRQGRAVVRAGFDFQLATSEFVNEGGERPFPLEGRFSGATLDLGARLGITDRFELEANLPIRVVTFTAEPTIIQVFEGTDAEEALRFYQGNLIDFSQAGAGIGDFTVTGRYQLLLRPLAAAIEMSVKAPTGYDGPEGTFGPEPDNLEDFAAQAETLVRPDNIRDDVTFGDGQLDVSAQLLLGAAFSTGTFVRAGGGYNLRFGGAADQVLADVRVGQALGAKVLVYGYGRLAYSIQQGRSVGISIIADDPELGPESFARAANTRPIVRRLETNLLEVGGGLIWRLTGPVEVNASYGRIVWGRFVAATHRASLGIGIRADFYDVDAG